MLIGTVGALSTFYPDAKHIHDAESRRTADPPADRQDADASPPTPTGTASACPYVYPDNDLSYTGNFLNMLFKMTEPKYQPNPVLERRSTCCSSCTPTTSRTARRARCAASAARTPIRTRRSAGAAAALYGPLHGGANEAVLRMLDGDRLASRTSRPSSSG